MKIEIRSAAHWIIFTLLPTLLIVGSSGAQTSEASTYFVAQTGKDSNTCAQAQSQSTPRLTINAGLSCLSAGDTLQVRGGTYAESINNVDGGSKLPSGTSFAAATTIMAYPGETVWLNPSGVNHVIDLAVSSYIVFDGIRIDGTGTNALTNPSSVCMKTNSGTNHVRYKNGECKNGGNGFQFAPDDGGYNEVLTTSIHDVGATPDALLPGHGFYISSPNNLVDGCTIYNIQGYGIQSYYYGHFHTVNNNIYRNNIVYSANLGTGHPYNSGILIGSGDNNEVYNNIVYNIANSGGGGGTAGAGITVDFLAGGTLIYNNTTYNNAGYGIALNNNEAPSNTVIKNNILWMNGNAGIYDTGTGTVQSNNLTTNPQFVNPTANNFQLQATSPAIDSGVTLSIVTTDMIGTPRPEGAAYDIGAYEAVTGLVLAAPKNLRLQ